MDNGPHNLAVLRHMALNVMGREESKTSLRAKFKKSRMESRLSRQTPRPILKCDYPGAGSIMAVFCILSWRVFWLTMLNRTAPDAVPTMALAAAEIELLNQLVADAGNRRCRPRTLSFHLTKLARLGGYLARASDPPPGNRVIWRGLSGLLILEWASKSGSRGMWVIESLGGGVHFFRPHIGDLYTG